MDNTISICKKIFKVCIHVYDAYRGQNRAVNLIEIGVSNDCEFPDIGSESQTWILCKRYS